MTKEFIHRGPVITYRTSPQPELDATSALKVIRSAWSIGRLQVSSHFHKRAAERGFDIMDAETIVRIGSSSGKAEFCPDFDNWKYKLVGSIEDSRLRARKLALIVALDPTNDYSRSPLAILITAYWID